MAFDATDESRHALQAARMLARSSGAQLSVITVFEPMSSGALTPGLASGGVSVNQIMRSALRVALDDVLAEQPEELAVEGRFLEGSAGENLAQESAELDLLVTGSRGYGPPSVRYPARVRDSC